MSILPVSCHGIKKQTNAQVEGGSGVSHRSMCNPGLLLPHGPLVLKHWSQEWSSLLSHPGLAEIPVPVGSQEVTATPTNAHCRSLTPWDPPGAGIFTNPGWSRDPKIESLTKAILKLFWPGCNRHFLGLYRFEISDLGIGKSEKFYPLWILVPGDLLTQQWRVSCRPC